MATPSRLTVAAIADDDSGSDEPSTQAANVHIERSPALPIFPALRARRRIVAVAAFVAALAPFAASADEFSSPLETSNWVFTWGGYVHAAYRWIEQPKNYNLVGRNN